MQFYKLSIPPAFRFNIVIMCCTIYDNVVMVDKYVIVLTILCVYGVT